MEYIPAPYKRYNGGKGGNGTYQGIINHIPPIKRLVSPFTGNGGVERRINMRGGSIVINDIDKDVFERYDKTKKQWERQFLSAECLNSCGLALMECFAHFTPPIPCSSTPAATIAQTLIYCDPPYLFDTRKSKQQLYIQEWQYDDHVRFLGYAKALSNKGYKIAISHPPHILYENALTGWNVYDYMSMTASGTKMWDRLWYNYPKPTELQDYQYLGKDYRQREVIARRLRRLVNNIFKLKDPLQRNAAIQALLDKKQSQ